MTPRELEIARLVTTGMRDADVTTYLGLSARTVHAHLRSNYSKLGIAGRQDLAATSLSIDGCT